MLERGSPHFDERRGYRPFRLMQTPSSKTGQRAGEGSWSLFGPLVHQLMSD